MVRGPLERWESREVCGLNFVCRLIISFVLIVCVGRIFNRIFNSNFIYVKNVEDTSKNNRTNCDAILRELILSERPLIIFFWTRSNQPPHKFKRAFPSPCRPLSFNALADILFFTAEKSRAKKIIKAFVRHPTPFPPPARESPLGH